MIIDPEPTGTEPAGTTAPDTTAAPPGTTAPDTTAAPPGTTAPVRAIIRRLVQLIVQFALFGAILFAVAGTIAWRNAWLFLAVALVCLAANAAYAMPRNPAVVAERGRRHTGTRQFDVVFSLVYTAFYLGLFVVAALDAVRLGWAPLGWPWVLAGTIAMLVSTIPTAAAMAANPYLERTVRIQHDRGHTVVSTGPYRFVRHPMYLSMLVQLPATALLLGSAWALLPALGAAVALVVRTALEDRTLRRDLPGYAGYAQHTRYRLVPGVW